jgi:hypothetical protein
MRYTLLIILSVVFVLQACSPEPVYRLKAQADKEQTSFYKGAEYLHLEKDSVLLILSYYEHTSDLFALDVEVVNKSDRILRVEPSAFSYFSYKEIHPDDPPEVFTSHFAEDPERKILDIDLALSKQKAKQKTDEFFYYTSQGLTLVEGVGASSNEEIEDTEDEVVRNRVDQEIDREQFRYKRMSLKEQKEVWQLDALRITDLLPGEQIRGLVFFKTTPDAHLYKITAEIEELTFETWFRQEKYKP